MNGDFGLQGQPSLSNQSTPVRNPAQQQQQQRAVFTKSSEDLLRDYGLDFSKLSMVSNINFDGAVSPTRPMVAPQRPARESLDILAELDPLNQNRSFVPASKPDLQSINFDPLAPVAPPRTKKASLESWTTFE